MEQLIKIATQYQDGELTWEETKTAFVLCLADPDKVDEAMIKELCDSILEAS